MKRIVNSKNYSFLTIITFAIENDFIKLFTELGYLVYTVYQKCPKSSREVTLRMQSLIKLVKSKKLEKGNWSLCASYEKLGKLKQR